MPPLWQGNKHLFSHGTLFIITAASWGIGSLAHSLWHLVIYLLKMFLLFLKELKLGFLSGQVKTEPDNKMENVAHKFI